MATLQLPDGSLLTQPAEIARELNLLDIDYKRYDPGTSLLFPDLAAQDVLADAAKQHILELHDSQFEFLKHDSHYLFNDLLNLHPGSPALHAFTTTYSTYHIHAEPEALYVLLGEAIYGFVRPDGAHLKLLLQDQDYLHIPAEVEHWFSPSASLTLKAVRYYSGISGWAPKYTGTRSQEGYSL
jgi:1,2-dihydroxy-3-keto-5-methylthiopentene dioxygenase